MKHGKQPVFIEAFPLLGEHPSGIAKLLFSTLDALLKEASFTEKYTVTLLVPLGKKSKLKKWLLTQGAFKVKVLPLPLRVINVLDRFHLMLPIDLLFGKGIYIFPNYRRLPLALSRSITYVHDAAYLLHPETIQTLNLVFLRRVIPRAVRKSDVIATLSRQSLHELQDAFPEQKDKIVVIPGGIDKEKYGLKTGSSSMEVILHTLKLKPKKYILFVGNIEPRKNLAYLIDVYATLVRKNSQYADVSLLLAGSNGWSNETVLEKIATYNTEGLSIIRPARRITDEELPVLYHESLLSVLLSVHEGFGMPPLEALSAGARVIVSDIPVLHEVGGAAVEYAPLNDTEAAADAFNRAIKTPANIAEANKQLEKFTWVETASRLRDCIDSLTDKRKG